MCHCMGYDVTTWLGSDGSVEGKGARRLFAMQRRFCAMRDMRIDRPAASECIAVSRFCSARLMYIHSAIGNMDWTVCKVWFMRVASARVMA